jgi:hypothetical protein
MKAPPLGFSQRLRALSLALLVAVSLQAGTPPKWLVKASQQPTPADVGDAPAVILLDEIVVSIDTDGQKRVEQHFAVRILNRAGLDNAFASVYYLGKSEKITDSHAWLLRNGTVIKPADSREWQDRMVEQEGGIYNEWRQSSISYSDIAFAGDVFAYSSVVEGPMIFCQTRIDWGSSLPLVTARAVVHLSPGWQLATCIKGRTTPAYDVSANRLTHTWGLANQPYRPDEAWVPPAAEPASTILLSFLPPPGTKASPAFQKWSDVVAYQMQLATTQCDTDATLAATAARLTAGCPDSIAKLRALGRYVQKLRYVEISRNLKLGFGYRPRKATEVLAKGFGDCKDKSNLLRALLREAGIRSYPAIAQAADEGNAEVFPEWPSPYQFNHMILAIEVDPKTDLSSVVQTPRLGSLLFFDPTNSDTEVGDIPWYLQGTRVEILAPGNEELTLLPDLPVDKDFAVGRRLKLSLDEKGTVTGEGTLEGWGQEGAMRRSAIRQSTAKELHDAIAAMLGAQLRTVSLEKLEPIDDEQTGRAGVSMNFSAPNFVQQLSGGLAIVRLNLLGHDNLSKMFSPTERTAILLTRPSLQTDEVVLALPPAYQVDELPKRESIQTPFGSYERFYELKDARIVSHRTFKLNKVTVQPSEYPAFRKFIYDVAKCDRSTVVLRQRT